MNELFAAFGIDWKVLLAQSVNFGVLMVGLTYFLYKPVMSMLKERQDVIAKGIEDAKRAGEAAKTTETERVEIIAKAEREAEGILGRGVEEGKKERAHIIERAQTQGDGILSDARLQAVELERQAIKKSEKEIAQAAILAAEKILASK